MARVWLFFMVLAVVSDHARGAEDAMLLTGHSGADGMRWGTLSARCWRLDEEDRRNNICVIQRRG